MTGVTGPSAPVSSLTRASCTRSCSREKLQDPVQSALGREVGGGLPARVAYPGIRAVIEEQPDDLGERGDVYEGHNPPSLRGLYDKDPYLHDGRAETLRAVLTGEHSPEMVRGSESLTEQELEDLIAYLKSL